MRTAFLWGLLEGLFFFIVPDVLLSFIAIRSFWIAIRGAFWVVLGAMVASVLVYFGLYHSGSGTPARILEFWGDLPGFRTKMAEIARSHLQLKAAAGMLLGPNSGIPYRVYVLEAWKLKIPLVSVILWTPFARLERILIVPLIVTGIKGVMKLLPGMNAAKRRKVLIVILMMYWVALYAWYWGKFIPKSYG